MAGKINSVKTEVDGILFDSRTEADFYKYLTKEKGLILGEDFQIQVTYQLLEDHIRSDGKKINGVKYVADFVIHSKTSNKVRVIDIKGMKTPDFILKEKMFSSRYNPLYIECVCRSPKYYSDETGFNWIGYDKLKKLRTYRRKINRRKDKWFQI